MSQINRKRKNYTYTHSEVTAKRISRFAKDRRLKSKSRALDLLFAEMYSDKQIELV